jgi:GAF domain-containing protein
LAYELEERYPPEPDEPGGVRGVLREGRPAFYPEINDEMLAATARDEEHLKLLREIGFTSAMLVPMIARGRTMGVITLVSAESGRRYEEDDLRLAEELARRAAFAVDNARLYEEAQKEIAERRRAQEELRGSRDQLEAVLRGVADGITAQDPSGRIVYANETAARLIGFGSARDLVEAPLEEVMAGYELLDEGGARSPPTGSRDAGPSWARKGQRKCCAFASWPPARGDGPQSRRRPFSGSEERSRWRSTSSAT